MCSQYVNFPFNTSFSYLRFVGDESHTQIFDCPRQGLTFFLLKIVLMLGKSL